MKGFIKKTIRGLALSAGLASVGGCVLYRQCVDPCWPERYTYEARMSVREIHNAQAGEGHKLDQTIWGWHFSKDPVTHEDQKVEKRNRDGSVMYEKDATGKILLEVVKDKDGKVVLKDGKPLTAPVPVWTAVLTSGAMEHLKYLAYREPAADPMLFLQRDLNPEINARREAAVMDYLERLTGHRNFVVRAVNVRDIRPVEPGDLKRGAETTIDYKTPFGQAQPQ